MAVVGFSPLAYDTGVFAEGAFSHLIQRLGPFKEVFSTANKATGLIVLEHSHLAIEFYNFKFRRSP